MAANKYNVLSVENQFNKITEFVYLGKKLSSSNEGSVTVKHGIGFQWEAFAKEQIFPKTLSYRLQNHTAKICNTYIAVAVRFGLWKWSYDTS